MIIPSKPNSPTKTFHNIPLRHNTFRTALGLLLMCCLLVPAGLLAKGLNSPQDATFSDQVALLQQSDNAATAPDTELEALGSLHIETLAEEARKLAQTKYLAEKFGQQPATVRKYVDLAWAEADKRDGIEPELLIAIMQKESSLRPRVQSRYGAQGLMQVVRRWHHDKLSPSESLFDPEVNIRVGADILEEYLELAGGSLIKALGKYSGSARGYPNRILKESRKLAQVAEQAATSG